jgi:hypothetical protein
MEELYIAEGTVQVIYKTPDSALIHKLRLRYLGIKFETEK